LTIGYIGSLKGGKKFSTNGCFRLHIYLHTNKTLIHNSSYIFDKWVKIEDIKRCSRVTTGNVYPKGQTDPDNWPFR
jgi:hypothetical protein